MELAGGASHRWYEGEFQALKGRWPFDRLRP